MQRRRFILAACAIAAASTVPGISSTASATDRNASRQDFKVGDHVRSESGALLIVREVSATRSDAQCHQYEVCFRHAEGPALTEGTHVLSGPGGSREVFMQPTANGLRADFSRLI